MIEEMSKIIGKVLDKANTDYFYFVSTEYFDANFVEVNVDHVYSGAIIIGEIIGKESLNPYFEKPTDIRYVDSEDEQVAKRSLFQAKVRAIAIINGEKRFEVSFPPKPGTNVLKAKEADIRIALGLLTEGIDIGTLSDYNGLPFKISPNQLLRTHIAILGQTGSGKSYFAAKMAIELIKFRKQVDIPSTVAVPIIFDSSGEYSSQYDNNAQNQLAIVMPVVNSKEHYFPLLNEKYLPLLSDIYEFDEREESELKPWLGYSPGYPVKESIQASFPELQKKADELIEHFKQMKFNSSMQYANALEELLKKLKTFSGYESLAIPYKAISKMRRLNLKIRKTIETDTIDNLSGGLIINLSDHDNYDERQIALLLFLRQLYETAKSKKSAVKMLVFIDEAHNYVPSIYKSFCKNEILRLAREGRKYGLTLCLISQRPRWVDPTALSQCGNVFIFRIQNSDDKKHVFDSVSLPDSMKELNIAKLKTGEMIVSGDVVDHAISCKVTKIDEDFIHTQQGQTAAKHLKEIEKM